MTAASPAITEADLVAYVDRRLDAERIAEVEAWLAENPAEKARIDGWMGQSDLLHTALDPILSEPIPAQIAEQFHTRRRRWFVPAAMAAGLVIGLGSGFLIWGGKDSPTAREIAAIALAAHEVYIAEIRHPVEVPVSDEPHLVAWLSNRLDTEIVPPDLSASGLTLLGGRVVPDDAGRPAAMLMYENAVGERYTLLIARTDSFEVTSFRYAWDEESCAYYWMDGTIAYAFSGPKDRELMLQLSRAIYDQIG